MNLNNIEDFGTNTDDSINTDYCGYCFQKGHFSQERTLDEMVESNLKYLKEYNAETGSTFTTEQARTELKQFLATLKRWN
jgi:ABC-type lipoprotein export system ATPase subunit